MTDGVTDGVTQRILLEFPGYEPESQIRAIKKGITLTLRAAKGASKVLDVVLFVPSHQDLVEEIFLEIFGESRAYELRAGKTARLQGCRLTVGTPQTPRKIDYADAVVAALVTEKQLDALDKVSGADIVVVIPWTADAASYWKAKWSPEVESAA